MFTEKTTQRCTVILEKNCPCNSQLDLFNDLSQKRLKTVLGVYA